MTWWTWDNLHLVKRVRYAWFYWYFLVMSLLDRRTCSIQETWSSAKSDTTNSCCRAPRMDSNRHHSLQHEIQCYLESKNPPLFTSIHLSSSIGAAKLDHFRASLAANNWQRVPVQQAVAEKQGDDGQFGWWKNPQLSKSTGWLLLEGATLL